MIDWLCTIVCVPKHNNAQYILLHVYICVQGVRQDARTTRHSSVFVTCTCSLQTLFLLYPGSCCFAEMQPKLKRNNSIFDCHFVRSAKGFVLYLYMSIYLSQLITRQYSHKTQIFITVQCALYRVCTLYIAKPLIVKYCLFLCVASQVMWCEAVMSFPKVGPHFRCVHLAVISLYLAIRCFRKGQLLYM